MKRVFRIYLHNIEGDERVGYVRTLTDFELGCGHVESRLIPLDTTLRKLPRKLKCARCEK